MNRSNKTFKVLGVKKGKDYFKPADCNFYRQHGACGQRLACIAKQMRDIGIQMGIPHPFCDFQTCNALDGEEHAHPLPPPPQIVDIFIFRWLLLINAAERRQVANRKQLVEVVYDEWLQEGFAPLSATVDKMHKSFRNAIATAESQGTDSEFYTEYGRETLFRLKYEYDKYREKISSDYLNFILGQPFVPKTESPPEPLHSIQINGAPPVRTIKITMNQLADFSNFVARMRSADHPAGIAVIQLPDEYIASLNKLEMIEKLKRLEVIKGQMVQQKTKKIPTEFNDVLEMVNIPYNKKSGKTISKFSINFHDILNPVVDNIMDSYRRFLNRFEAGVPLVGDYIAGVNGSLTPDNENFDFFNLENQLSSKCDKIEGVTTPWVYVGYDYSGFAFHVEDASLGSGNINWGGNAKNWIAVPVANRYELEALAVDLINSECRDPLSHKTTFIGMDTLKNSGIPFTVTAQREYQIVITFPGAHHAGYNSGANVSQAINFVPFDWLPYFERCRITKKNHCSCVGKANQDTLNEQLRIPDMMNEMNRMLENYRLAFPDVDLSN